MKTYIGIIIGEAKILFFLFIGFHLSQAKKLIHRSCNLSYLYFIYQEEVALIAQTKLLQSIFIYKCINYFFFKSNSYDSSFDPSTIDFSKSTGLTFLVLLLISLALSKLFSEKNYISISISIYTNLSLYALKNSII